MHNEKHATESLFNKKKGEYAQNVLIYMRGTMHLKIVHKTLNKLSEADIKHL